MALGFIRVVFFRAATRMVTPMVSTAAYTTVEADMNSMYSRNTMGMIRWPWAFSTSRVRGSCSLGTPTSPSLEARSWTWIMIPM